MYGWRGLIVILALLPTHAPRRKPAPKRPALSMAASVPDARKLFEAGLTAFENEHYPQAVDNWRQALRKDPRFALAHLFISFVSTDPQEQKSELRSAQADRKSTRLNSSHVESSYAVFCLKKKKTRTSGAGEVMPHSLAEIRTNASAD